MASINVALTIVQPKLKPYRKTPFPEYSLYEQIITEPTPEGLWAQPGGAEADADDNSLGGDSVSTLLQLLMCLM